MNLNAIQENLIMALDEIGIIIDCTQKDFNLQEYISDSVTLITFVVNVEKRLGIEIPDEMLLITRMSSFVAYCEMVKSIVDDTHNTSQ